ncbi:hypothetical protein [Natronospira sp.]|uniref:hypothetical protein n=1 Tax=Natronospira sp. TaxID=2024970 RepID=UPI003872C015
MGKSPQNKTGAAPHVGPSEAKKWGVALSIAAVLFGTHMVYILEFTATTQLLMAVSFAMAATASFLYAMAFSSGSLSYYIGWPNMRDGYQKQIGVMGFWFSFAYSITLVVLYPELYWYGLADNFWTWDVTLGLTAMTIFGAMTVINSKPIAPYFSWDTIKFVLGLGFVGYALLVIRAIFIEFDLWMYWLTTFDGDIPGRLVLSVVAVGVLMMRISVPIHIKLFGTPRPKK